MPSYDTDCYVMHPLHYAYKIWNSKTNSWSWNQHFTQPGWLQSIHMHRGYYGLVYLFTLYNVVRPPLCAKVHYWENTTNKKQLRLPKLWPTSSTASRHNKLHAAEGVSMLWQVSLDCLLDSVAYTSVVQGRWVAYVCQRGAWNCLKSYTKRNHHHHHQE